MFMVTTCLAWTEQLKGGFTYSGQSSTVSQSAEDETVTDIYLDEAFGELIAATGDYENSYLNTGGQVLATRESEYLLVFFGLNLNGVKKH